MDTNNTTEEALLVTSDQPLALIGFQDNVQARQELIVQLCNELKLEINQKLDQYCIDLKSCIEDKRSYFSIAYWTGALPTSEQEIIQMIESGKEISQTAVDNVVSSFHERCTSKLPYIERAIDCLQQLDPSIDRSSFDSTLNEIRAKDRLIVDNLTKSATWRDVLHVEDDGTLGNQF
jgi:hypothetical protein